MVMTLLSRRGVKIHTNKPVRENLNEQRDTVRVNPERCIAQ